MRGTRARAVAAGLLAVIPTMVTVQDARRVPAVPVSRTMGR